MNFYKFGAVLRGKIGISAVKAPISSINIFKIQALLTFEMLFSTGHTKSNVALELINVRHLELNCKKNSFGYLHRK